MSTLPSQPLTNVDTFVEKPGKPQFADFELKATVVTRLASLQSNATAIIEGESNDQDRDGNVPTLTATLSSIPEPNITYSDLNDKG
jgi:hypothetical protein